MAPTDAVVKEDRPVFLVLAGRFVSGPTHIMPVLLIELLSASVVRALSRFTSFLLLTTNRTQHVSQNLAQHEHMARISDMMTSASADALEMLSCC